MKEPRLARAVVPGHITGLFRIHDDCEDILQCGSTGAGFCTAAGTLTSVEIRDSITPQIKVEYNEKPIDGPVTKAVIERLNRDFDCSYDVLVRHDSSLPIGVGWGASGAGALGTAIAYASLISDDISTIQASQYAHAAEVESRTGLGDVIAQTYGGFEIRYKPGAPGVGKLQKIPVDIEYQIVLAGGTGLVTSKILTDPSKREKINKVGDSLISDLLENPTVSNFVENSRKFSSEIGLQSDRISTTLDQLENNDIDSGMVMLGDSIFCLCVNNSEVDTAIDIVSKYWDSTEIITTSITDTGGGLFYW
jgi:pantoate kinase